MTSRKRSITHIGTHIFPLGHMVFARRVLRVCMFFELARAKNPVAERLIHTRDQKPFDIINCDMFFPPPEK